MKLDFRPVALLTMITLALVVACQQVAAPAPQATAEPPAKPAAEAKPAAKAPAAKPAAKAPAAKPAAKAKPKAAEKPAPQGPTGTLVVAISRSPSNLDPITSATAQGLTGAEYGFAVSNALLALDHDGSVIAALAESWKVSDDRLSWTLELREGVKFSNGDSLTPADVKFTLERFVDAESGYPSFTRLQPFLKAVEIVDGSTVRITTNRPDALFASRLTYVPIVSEASFSALSDEEMGTKAPASTGTFMLKSKEGDKITLVANPNAWQPAKLETIELNILGEAAVRMAALQTGEVDFMATLTPDLAEGLAKLGDFEIHSAPSPASVAILMDSASESKHPALEDVRVREALNISIDRAAFVKAITGEYGIPGSQSISSAINGFNPNLDVYPYDPERAKELVKEAGFEGTTIVMSGVFTRGLGTLTGAQAIADAMNQTGINIEIEVLEIGVFIGRYNGGGASPMIMFPLGAAHLDADGAIQNFLDKGARNPNKIRYSNPEFDAVYAESTREFDPAKRRVLLQQAAKIIYDDYAFIPMGNVPRLSAYYSKLKNFDPYDQYRWNFWDMVIEE